MKIFNTLLEAIGNTPLVRVPFKTPAKVYAKLEYLNPGGSIKDRAALYMIQEAERLGLLKPGGTVIEASSGNQGIATAMIGAMKGYKVIITVSEKISEEKQKTLQAYGAELVRCKPTMQLDAPDSYHSKAVEIHRNTPNSFMLNQYFNPTNAHAHYAMLGPEIWDQTEGTITHYCAAAGSGGTVSGAGKYLKERNNRIKVIGVDVPNSYRSTNKNPQPYKLEGIGVDYDTPLLNNNVIDDFFLSSDDDSIAMLKTMAREYGLLIGPSSGAVAYAASQIAPTLTEKDTLVMIFGDSGRAYLTKNFY
jgi:cystathionine beta-synthase